MRRKLKKLIFIFLLTFGVNAFGATYYVKTDGSDDSSGTTWSAAWLTMAKVESSISGGDTVQFAPGTYRGVFDSIPSGTSSDRTCLVCSSFVDDYPCSLLASDQITSGWELVSGSIHKRAYDPTYELSNDSKAWTWVQDTTLMWPTTAMPGSAGRVYHNSTVDSVYIWCWDNDNPNDCTIEASASPVIYVRYNNTFSYTTFYGFFMGLGSHKIVLFGDYYHPNYCYIDHCQLKWVAGPAQQNTACIGMSVISTSDTTRNGHFNRARSCHLSYARDANNGNEHQKSISLYQESDFVAESCYITQVGIGIDYKNQMGGPACRNNIMRFNFIDSAYLQGINIYCHASDYKIYGNTIYKAGDIGISIKSLNSYGGHQIYNNTIIETPKAFATGYEGITYGHNYFKYNIVYSVSSRENAYLAASDSLYWTVDSNVYYPSGSSFRRPTTMNFTTWQASTGYGGAEYLDPHSTNTVNPVFNENYEPTNIPAWDNPITYGGRTWYGPGAVQTLWESPPPPPPPVNPNRRKRIILNTEQ